MYRTCFSHQVEIPNIRSIKIDQTKLSDLKEIFTKINQDFVIHSTVKQELEKPKGQKIKIIN